MKHLLRLHELSAEEVKKIFDLTAKLKQKQKQKEPHKWLSNKTLGLIFSKSSTRTRVSFETGMFQLGGHALFLSAQDIQLGRGETIQDTAATLSRYIDGIMIRTFLQSDVEQLATHGTVPVINGLTDDFHPCQALADLFTLYECKGALQNLKLAYVGDGNNVAHSLLAACAKTGTEICVATPKGYECNPVFVNEAMQEAKKTGATIQVTNDPVEAVEHADAVYTDTWISMGQEEEKQKRIDDFAGFCVDEQLFAYAADDAIFLHCLPAYRGFEVSASIIDGPMSRVFDEAENRLHVQKAVMVLLMGEENVE